jgi:hypothetical protein
MSRRKFIKWLVAVGGTAALASCGLLKLAPLVDQRGSGATETPSSEIWTPTPQEGSPTPEPPTETPTVESTPIPEVGDPTNIESWPAWAQDFFINHPEDATQDARFQEFLDLSRRDYLLRAGVAGVETMDSEQLMREMIRLSATEQMPLVLAPTEIIKMMTDHGEWMRPVVDPANGLWYNLWANIPNLVRNPRIAPLPPLDEEFFAHVTGESFDEIIFDRSVTITGLEQSVAYLDFSGVVRLPGGEDHYAILMRYVEPENRVSHYRVYRVLNGPTSFDTNNQCMVDEEYTSCPFEIKGDGIRIATVASGNRDNFPPHTASDPLQYLHWPPPTSTIELLITDTPIPVVIRVFDPESGLPIGDLIRIDAENIWVTPQNP